MNKYEIKIGKNSPKYNLLIYKNKIDNKLFILFVKYL